MTALDLTGVACPLNWVKARLELERLSQGQSLRIQLDPGEPVRSVCESARRAGHTVSTTANVVTIVKS